MGYSEGCLRLDRRFVRTVSMRVNTRHGRISPMCRPETISPQHFPTTLRISLQSPGSFQTCWMTCMMERFSKPTAGSRLICRPMSRGQKTITACSLSSGTKIRHHGNHIATIFVGPMVKPGKYSENINHYNVLRTLEALYGLPYAGKSASVTTITDVWQ